MFNKDFFPTAQSTIQKMIDTLTNEEKKSIKTILDPSVWKWDIIKYLKENTFRCGNYKFYGIEIEYQLREISKQYCEIIWYDFLTFNNNYYNFDLIIANFPFSEWVKHFLKAWDLMNGGILVCLVNAETLKNPYSEERKLMLKIIEDNNWEVQYLQNEFLESERKTKVEVALIKIKKESVFNNYFAWIEKDYLNEYKSFDEWWETEIVKWNDKVDHLLRLNQILKKESLNLHLAIKKYYKYKALLNADDYSFKQDNFDLNERIIEINKYCWHKIFQETWFFSKMTSKSYDMFMKEYQNSSLDFTSENLHQVKTILMSKYQEAIKESILEVFDLFTKYYPENRAYIEGWQHNSQFMIWKKVILPNYCEKHRNTWEVKLNTYFYWKITDIEKVLCHFAWMDFNNIFSLKQTDSPEWETTFFKYKMYKKGTLHLEFKDKDLIQKLNYYVCAEKKWIMPKDFKFKI